LFGKQPHGYHGDEEETDHADVGQERPNDPFIEVHRKHLATHHGLCAFANEKAQNVPEKEAENDGEHGQQEVRDGRNEIASQLLAENNPDVSHLLDSCGYAAFFGGRAGHFAGELQKDFFKTDGGGTQFVEVPAGFDHRAGEIAADQAFAAFHF